MPTLTALTALTAQATRTPPQIDPDLRRLLARGVAVVALAGVALVHLVQMPDTARQTTSLAVLFGVLALSATVVATALMHTDHPLLWYAAALTAIGPIAGYILTRSAAMPFDSGDVGNWTEPLGLAALFIEGSLLGLCVYQLRTPPTRAPFAPSPR